MKVDIHSHTRKKSLCSQIVPKELVMMAEAVGYDVVFLTDHGRVWTPSELAEIREWSDHVRILPGIEISLANGVDLLVLGASSTVYERLSEPSDVFAQACADGCLTVVAHPFRWLEELPDFCALADAIEIRTCNHPSNEEAEAAQAYAATHKLAPLYASDAHGLNYLNRFWLETETSFRTAQEFRHLVLAGRYENRMKDDVPLLPPEYKAATMEELSEDDRQDLLQTQPTA